MGSYSNGVDNILHEQDALEFEETKIKELHKVLQNCFDGFLGNGVVFAGAERAR